MKKIEEGYWKHKEWTIVSGYNHDTDKSEYHLFFLAEDSARAVVDTLDAAKDYIEQRRTQPKGN